MASGFFAILDDIATLMDDVASASKIATQKTAGILGDDLAVNAEKATGFVSSRELPVLWAITKGSFINKLIIIPAALSLNYFFPVVINIILVLGGIYLAYEGVEKVVEYLFHSKSKVGVNIDSHKVEESTEVAEKTKIKSAVLTDFILSVEIVIIALGSVINQSFAIQAITVSIVAVLATIGVYGIVALIVRMDDAGYFLIRKSKNKKKILTKLGRFLVRALPVVIKVLAIVGTIALLLVSGGIFSHNIDFLHHTATWMPGIVKDFLLGLSVGVIAVTIISVFKKMTSK